MRLIKFYETTSGRKPVEEFMDSLKANEAQKVVWVLKLIEDLRFVPTEYFKKLRNTDDIWEVRARYGNNTFRLLGFMDKETLVVLTNAFAKKNQKTPKSEIDLAEKRRKEYLAR
jgi:phage-related protein